MTVQYVLNATGVQLALSGATTRSITGTTAAETLLGTAGNDKFAGGGGGDTLMGGQGDDSYYIYDRKDGVVENAGEGVDTVVSTVSFTLSANVENLSITKADRYGEGNDLNNIMTGSAGTQTFYGAGGDDILTGGAGADIFIQKRGGGHDVITDFETGIDKAQLGGSGLTTFAQVKAAMVQQGADVSLSYATGEQLVFRNHQIADFTSQDFQLPLNTNGLSLAFDDEFNSLSLYNGSGGNYSPGAGTWWTKFASSNILTSYNLPTNNEQQIYVAPGFIGSGTTAITTNPFSLNNGIATITANPATAAEQGNLFGMGYTSGVMSTKLSYAQTYGYFEIKAKLPEGNGLWPAFWMMPLHSTGELDVFEQLGKDPSTIYQTSHSAARGSTISTAVHLDSPDQFHTYGMLWDKNYLIWYIDGVETSRQATPADLNSPMYMIMNLAVGGTWPGNPDSTTPFPASMGIDYVRTYTLNSSTPSAVSDAYAVSKDSVLAVGVANGLLANDTTPTSNSLSASLVAGAAHGTVSVSADGSFTYRPTAGYAGSDSFTYKAVSGTAQSSIATVNLTVNAVHVNQAPVVSGQVVLNASNEDAPRVITTAELQAAATDADGDTLAVTGLSASAGVLTDNHDGTWTYQPAAHATGLVDFTFQVSDGTASTAATARLDLVPVNDPPAVSGTVILAASAENAPRTIASAELLAMASDLEGDALVVTGLTASSGSLTDNHDGTWTFQPAANDSSQVSFSFQVSDGQAATATNATLDLLPVNSAPVVGGSVTLVASAENAPRTITSAELLALASDIDGDALSVTGLTASSGSLTDNHDGTWTFQPDAGDSSQVSFSFQVSDGQAATAAGATLDLLPVNHAPIVGGSVTLAASNEDAPRLITTAELLALASDPDGDALTVTGLTVSSGVLTDNHNGTWTFQPGANDSSQVSFSYQVSDGQVSATASASLDLLPVNDAPTVAGQAVLAASNEDAARVITTAELLGRASDVDGDTLNIVGLTASSGTLVDNHDGTWAFQPGANDSSQVSFSYQVSDGALATAGAATLDLLPVNDAPVTGANTASVVSGSSVTLSAASLLANDTDVDGDPLSIVSVAMGATPHGTVQLINGSVVYTPTAGYSGADSFTYFVTDGHVTQPVAGTVNVTVTAAPTSSVVTTSAYVTGTANADVINLATRTAAQSVNGQAGNDTITGGSAADSLNGSTGNDTIVGGAGGDTLTGGVGTDTLTGGLGADRFTWTALNEFGPAGQEDRITDFNHAEADLLVLSQIDANSVMSGNQAFSFLGTGAFTHKAGQLDYAVIGSDVMVYGDVNGDGVADFQFRVLGVHSLQSSDFIL